MNFPPLASRALRGVAASLALAGLLGGCGGGTTQVDQFSPERVLAWVTN